MSTAVKAAASIGPARASMQRIASIDIFRGITMAVMIFVNALDDVRGLPWWTHHAHANWDLMTYVDMVFPFFLFAIGLSLPIAVESRLKRNPSSAALWIHIVVRSVSLVVLGLILANAEKADRTRMPAFQAYKRDPSQFLTIGLSLPAGDYQVVNNTLRNVPDTVIHGWLYPGPSPVNFETFYIDPSFSKKS